MTTLELHWLAGLLEGEGSFCYMEGGPIKKTPRIRVQLRMIDEDVVRRAAALMEDATVYSYPGEQYGRQRSYLCMPTGYKAARIMRLILPVMGRRRQEQITTVLLRWDARPVKRKEWKRRDVA